MSILFVLVPLALLLVAVAVAGFFWAVRSGQFEDTQTPAVRILLDSDQRPDSMHAVGHEGAPERVDPEGDDNPATDADQNQSPGRRQSRGKEGGHAE